MGLYEMDIGELKAWARDKGVVLPTLLIRDDALMLIERTLGIKILPERECPVCDQMIPGEQYEQHAAGRDYRRAECPLQDITRIRVDSELAQRSPHYTPGVW